MEYHLLERPLKSEPNSTQFLHAVTLVMAPSRYPELEQFLNDSAGPKHEAWRIQARFMQTEAWKSNWESKHVQPAAIRFRSKDQAILFKLSWQECDDPRKALQAAINSAHGPGSVNKVILPIIRRTAPQYLAHEILSVQNMIGEVPPQYSFRVNMDISEEKLEQLTKEYDARQEAIKRQQEIERAKRQQQNDIMAELEELTGKPFTIRPTYLETTQSIGRTLRYPSSTTVTLTLPDPAGVSSASDSPSTKTSTDVSGNEQK